MDVLHHGNWRVAGRLVVGHWGMQMDVFECPICFALTREPTDHANHHLKHKQATTQRSV